MTTTIEQSLTTPEQINDQLNRQIAVVESMRVRGWDTVEAHQATFREERETALQLQEAFSEHRGWNIERKDHYYSRLATYLDREPQTPAYHNWLLHYANIAKTADSRLKRDEATNNAEAVLETLATKHDWPPEKLGQQLAKMWHAIGSPISPSTIKPQANPESTKPKNKRLKKLAGAIGSGALVAYIALQNRASKPANDEAVAAPAPDPEPGQPVIIPLTEAESPAEDAPNKKRRLRVAGAVLGTLAVGVVIADTVLAMNGHGIGLRDIGIHFGGDHGNGPGVADAHHHLPGNGAPSHSAAPSPSPSPSPNTGGSGTHHHHHHGDQSSGGNHARILHEHLRFRGDTIYQHIQHTLGKDATEHQVNTKVGKVLRFNHLTYAQARHLPVGFEFLVKTRK